MSRALLFALCVCCVSPAFAGEVPTTVEGRQQELLELHQLRDRLQQEKSGIQQKLDKNSQQVQELQQQVEKLRQQLGEKRPNA